MKHIFRNISITSLLLFSVKGNCCINCNKDVQQAIKSSFMNNPSILLGFAIITLVLIVLSLIAFRNPDPYRRNYGSLLNSSKTPLTAAAIVLGIGIGGFIDGIVFHQILQWHEMLSNKIPPTALATKSANMFWDGIFHLFTLLVTVVGIFLLWKVLRRRGNVSSSGILSGGMIAGWGLFNILEGILNHHILNLHNVRESGSNQDWWNFGFLIFSIILLSSGMLLVHGTDSSEDT